MPTERGHILLTKADCPCDKSSEQPCMVCDAGLDVCSICHLAERELDEDCPGPSGPDYFDGHDHDGFIGGCARMGCPGGKECTEL